MRQPQGLGCGAGDAAVRSWVQGASWQGKTSQQQDSVQILSSFIQQCHAGAAFISGLSARE